MDKTNNEKEANEIYIKFNNENFEFDHDYTKPFSRSKSIVERNSYSNNDSIQTETYKSKKSTSNNKNDENVNLNQIKKQFYNLCEEFDFYKTHFNNVLCQDLIEQREFMDLFSIVEKQNNLMKETLPYLSFTTESKRDYLNDKLKNNFINKIYLLETKLSEKESLIIKLKEEIESQKNQNSNNKADNNNNKSNAHQNSESESGHMNDSISSPQKSPYNGFVNIARNSISPNNKLLLIAKISSSEARNKINKNENNSNSIIIADNSSKQIKEVNNFEIDNGISSSTYNHKKPEFYQRKKNNVVNEEQRSRSFCYGNANNQSVSGLDLNFSVLNENERNTENDFNNFINVNENINDYNNKDFFMEETDAYKDSKEKTKAQTEPQSNGNSLENVSAANKSKVDKRGRNISLLDFNNLHNLEAKENIENNKNYINNIEIEMKNNSFTDITDNANFVNTIKNTNNNNNNDTNPNNINKYLSSPENKIFEINKNHFINNLNKKNNLIKDQEILNKIKDSFLSLSSYDNSLNSSLNNISQISNKSGNINNNQENDNRKIRRNKSLFNEKPKLNSEEEDEENSINYPNRRKSQNFCYLNLLINNKNLQQSKKDGKINYDSERENSDFYDNNNNLREDEINNKNKINNRKELNMNLINEALKVNSNDNGNLISNSPLHHNMEAINNQLNLFNYKSFKNNSNDNNVKGKGVYENQSRNKPKNKSNSVLIKNRKNRDYKNFKINNNYNNQKNKIEKIFAEDNFIINTEQDMSTEPLKSNINDKFYLEKLAFDINLENLNKMKIETSKNQKLSGRYLKEFLFKKDIEEDEIINLNSEETQGKNNNINNNDKGDKGNELRFPEQKEELNFSFNNSKNDIKQNSNYNIKNILSLENKENNKIAKPSIGNSDNKNVKKISMLRNDRNIPVKKDLNDKKLLEVKNPENKKAEVIHTISEENKMRNSKEIKFQNPYLNKKLVKDNNHNSKALNLNTKESLEQTNIHSSMIIKSKEYSKNIKALNDKNIKKQKVKNTNEFSKADLENDQSISSNTQNSHNNNKSKVSSVKMRKNYEKSLTQNRNNLLNKLNKKSNVDLTLNVNNNNNTKFAKNNLEDNDKDNHKDVKKKNYNINSNKLKSVNTKSNILTTSSLQIENNSEKNLISKKPNCSKSTCDLKNEIYLNITKDAVFSLKPDEGLNLSENEYISNKESSKHENYKESCENIFSLENEKTPSDKKSKNLIKESSINKITEDTSNDPDVGHFVNFNKNKYTLSHKDLILPNNKNKNSNSKYFDRFGNESKRLSSRSKSFVEFDKININNKSFDEGLHGNNFKNKGYNCLNNQKTKIKNENNNDNNATDSLLGKINERNKNKIDIITSYLHNKNAKKAKLETSLNESIKSHNQTQSSISFNFINNISINAPENSSFIIEDNDKPVTYTKKLLAKYYKYVDDYNKRISNEGNKSSKNSKLNDSKTSRITNKKQI